MRNEVCIRAPAKVNLILRILDRLPTGYHKLWSIMQTVDLADRLTIRVLPSTAGITLRCENSTVPQDRTNLVFRAAELVLRQAGSSVGLEIVLDKHIPMAAGMGGGSSDAAATIFGLVRLLDLDWSMSDMAKIGAELGSDIPFFFSAPCACVGGWGQEVLPLSMAGERWIVLVNPGFPIETKWAYDRLASTRKQVLPLGEPLKNIEVDQAISWDRITSLMENDFEAPLFPVFPELETIKEEFMAAGAQAALLSGSGATMFGVFSDEKAACRAKSALAHVSQRNIILARSLSSSIQVEEPAL